MYTIHHVERENGTTIQARYGWDQERQSYLYSIVLCERTPQVGELDCRHYAPVVRVLAKGIEQREAAASIVDILGKTGLPPVHGWSTRGAA